MTLALLTLSLTLHPAVLPHASPSNGSVIEQQARAETPGEFYERYLATVESAQTVEELYEFWSDGLRAQIKAMNPRNANIDIRSVRAAYPVLGVKVVRTVPIRNSDVMLFLEGTSSTHGTKATGSVVVTNEHGTWKVADLGGWTIKG